jgi:citrate lyase subunit beta/citryl-CoA lyase
MSIKPRRSVLYMPGSNARALEKAKTLPADCFIFDLEDAVAPDAKADARQQVCDAVAAGGYGKRELIIRINSLNSDWGKDDLGAAIKAKPDAILVPKVNSTADLEPFADSGIAIWAMMETPLAMLNTRDIAFSANLDAFVMGTNDLAKETGASLGNRREAMMPWLMTCVAAARAAGVSIIDGVFNDFKNDQALRLEAQQGADCGMDGKTIIHPGQIAACNEIFAPSEQEIQAAEAIIEAFSRPENKGKGAINLNGRMVELLHCDMARKTIAIVEAIRQKQADQ